MNPQASWYPIINANLQVWFGHVSKGIKRRGVVGEADRDFPHIGIQYYLNDAGF